MWRRRAAGGALNVTRRREVDALALQGYLALILHAHLPFVRHPGCSTMLEERWLFEAVTESYVPLLLVLDGLERDGVPGGITISLTPPLAAMLDDPLLRARYLEFLDRNRELAGREAQRTASDPGLAPVAEMYRRRLDDVRAAYCDRYGRDVVGALRGLQDRGRVEVMASAATHGFLPLLDLHAEAVEAQVAVGVAEYRRRFGRDPAGFWLPECGFAPGVDRALRRHGIRYTVLETHGVLHASRRPRYGAFAPIYCPSGVAALPRDVESSKQVWSADEGYPGDSYYRDFYRDIGYDLDLQYLEPYLPGGGVRTHTGFKYYRITGPGQNKAPYDPWRAREKAAEHAGNFVFNRGVQASWLSGGMDRPPLITAPYDAELFGHWWFEGPQWLDFVLRKLAYDQDTVAAITPSQYLDRYPRNQVAMPSLSSWGYKGYSEVWLEGSNDWIWRHVHRATGRMIELANAYPDAPPHLGRVLNQAARELLLAQASDWAFIMKTGTSVDYARRRTVEHLAAFWRLRAAAWPPGAAQGAGGAAVGAAIDEGWLQSREAENTIFPELDYRVFRSERVAAGAGAGAPVEPAEPLGRAPAGPLPEEVTAAPVGCPGAR